MYEDHVTDSRNDKQMRGSTKERKTKEKLPFFKSFSLPETDGAASTQLELDGTLLPNPWWKSSLFL